MAVIKVKRGSGVPTGLTAFEPAWDNTFGRFFINNGSTAVWIGARIDNSSTLGGAGSCAYYLPTQLAVKTYIDAQVAGGAVSSVDGVTGAVDLIGGTGISITLPTGGGKGITFSVNSFVPLKNDYNTFTKTVTIEHGTLESGLFVQSSGNSSSIELDGYSTSIQFYDYPNGKALSLSPTVGGLNNNTIYLPSETGVAALRDVAQTFTALQTFTSGISASGATFSGAVNFLSNITAPNLVTSVDGVTGAVDLLAGSGISITLPTGAAKGITLAVNSNVALLDTAQTFTALKTFSAGISASGATFGSTVSFGLSGFGSSNISLLAGTNTISAPGNNRIVISTGDTVFGLGVQNSTNANQINIKPFSNEIEFYEFSSGSSVILNSGTMVAGTTYTVTLPGYGTILAGLSGTQTFTGTKSFSSLANFSAGVSASGGTFSGRLNVLPASGSNAFINTSSGSLLYVGTTGGAAFAVDGGNDELQFWANGTLKGYFNTSGLFVTDGLGSITQVPTTRTTVASLNGATGTVTIGAGTGLSVATSVSSRGITFTNTGVTGLTGTVNQITVSGTTGSITLSLPSAITVPGSLATTTTLSVGTDLTVTGNLTVNGTTTTVNSNTVTIQDPVIAIGGAGTTNAPPPSGDTKDRGIVFQWRNGLQSATGFFGHDTSTGYFTYIPTFATVTNDVIGGCAGTAQFANVYGPSGVTFTIAALDTESAVIRARGGSNYNNTAITLEAANVNIGNGTNKSGLRFLDGSRRHTIFPSFPASDNRTYDLPDHSGTFVVPSDLGSIAGYILTSQGATAQPVWIKPDDVGTGITASAAKLVTVSSSTDTTSFLTFIDTASNSNQAIRYNSSLAYNATTNYLDVNIDCGTY